MISSITSLRFRKFVLEANLREFPHIHSRAVQDNLTDKIGQLDRPLCTLAKNSTRAGDGKLLFVLLAHNALGLVQRLTELNAEGDIVVGEKIIGGDYACVYIPALVHLRRVIGRETEMSYSICEFL